MSAVQDVVELSYQSNKKQGDYGISKNSLQIIFYYLKKYVT